MAILSGDSFLFSAADLYANYRFLVDFFRNEFHQPPDETPEQQIQRTIDAFVNDGIAVPNPELVGTYHLTSLGYRKLKSFALFLKPLFESYWIVLHAIAKSDGNGRSKKNGPAEGRSKHGPANV